MSAIKLGLSGRSILEKIADSQHILTSMTDNDNFPAPTPSLADFQVTIDNLSIAQEATFDGGPATTQVMYQREAEHDQVRRDILYYVLNVAQGASEIEISSGYPLATSPGPPTIMAKVEDLSAKTGNLEGDVFLNWKRVKGSRVYYVQFTTDPLEPEQFAELGYSSKSRFTAKGLKSGQLYWFRISAIGPVDRGEWSDPAIARAK